LKFKVMVNKDPLLTKTKRIGCFGAL